MTVSLLEILIVAAVVALVFFSGRLPKLMADLATGFQNLKAGLKEDRPPDASPEAGGPPPAPEPKLLPASEPGAAQQKRDTPGRF
ncbi:MAG: twin-arginine translocase TatA/TatE family subunit [Alphaproteobacteria bacterium]|nr:twin-arginine translocase TatA/TatE family subunit [Alphaproteobacteria bacterium]